jgi:hypothetical protein
MTLGEKKNEQRLLRQSELLTRAFPSDLSKTVTLWPARCSVNAVAMPASPPPTTTTRRETPAMRGLIVSWPGIECGEKVGIDKLDRGVYLCCACGWIRICSLS